MWLHLVRFSVPALGQTMVATNFHSSPMKAGWILPKLSVKGTPLLFKTLKLKALSHLWDCLSLRTRVAYQSRQLHYYRIKLRQRSHYTTTREGGKQQLLTGLFRAQFHKPSHPLMFETAPLKAIRNSQMAKPTLISLSSSIFKNICFTKWKILLKLYFFPK